MDNIQLKTMAKRSGTAVICFTARGLQTALRIREIMPDSAAEEAGLLPGDTIRKINGERIHLYREVSAISIFNYGTPLTIEFEREGEAYEVLLTPRYSEEDDRYYIGLIGSGDAVISYDDLELIQITIDNENEGAAHHERLPLSSKLSGTVPNATTSPA